MSVIIMAVEELDQRNVQLDLDANIRGRIISQFNFINVWVGTIIAHHYVSEPEKKIQFYEDMIMDMSFSRKSSICRKLLKNNYRDHYDKRLWNRIDEVAKFRNKIAHHIAAVSDEFIAEKHIDRVMFIRFPRDPDPPTIITLEQMTEYTLETFEISKGLFETFRAIFPDEEFLS